MSSLIFRIINQDRGNSSISIVGNIIELGMWDPKKSVQLNYQDGFFRTDEVKLNNYDNLKNIEYKYIKCKRERNEVVLKDIIWEEGANRKLNIQNHFQKIGIDQDFTVRVIVEDKGFNMKDSSFPKILQEQLIIQKELPLIKNKDSESHQNSIDKEFQDYQILQKKSICDKNMIQNEKIIQQNDKQMNNKQIENKEILQKQNSQIPLQILERPSDLSDNVNIIQFGDNSNDISQILRISKNSPKMINSPLIKTQNDVSEQNAYFNNTTQESYQAYQDIIQNIQNQQNFDITPYSDYKNQIQDDIIKEMTLENEYDDSIDKSNQIEENFLVKNIECESIINLKDFDNSKTKQKNIINNRVISTGGTTSFQKQRDLQQPQSNFQNTGYVSNVDDTSDAYFQNPTNNQQPPIKSLSDLPIQFELKQQKAQKLNGQESVDQAKQNIKAIQNETGMHLFNSINEPNIDESQKFIQLNYSQSNQSKQKNFEGITLESMTGPICQIDEIDDFSLATVGLLKDAVCHCLNLSEWVQRNHIQLYYQGIQLTNDNTILEEWNIHPGAKISYIIFIA